MKKSICGLIAWVILYYSYIPGTQARLAQVGWDRWAMAIVISTPTSLGIKLAM